MGKPNEEELKQALKYASKLRNQDQDPNYLAKAVLSYHHRYEMQRKAISAAKLYLHSGEGAREHAELVKAIEAAEQAHVEDHEEIRFGLE